MNQIEHGLPATLGFTFEQDGQATNPTPDAATVTIRTATGVVLVSEADADDVGEGSVTYELAPDDVPLGVLTVEWTGVFDGYSQTKRQYVEVVGGFYFTVSEARAKYSDLQDKSWDEIAGARALAEEIIEGLESEDGCHQAFVPRAETFDLPGGHRMQVPRYRVRSIDAVTIDGEAADPDILWLDGNNIFGAPWRGPVNVTVTHGWDLPPARIKDAAITLAYHRLVKGPIDDRAIGRLSPEGSLINLSTPGMRGAVTGIPEVDAAISQYRKRRIRPTSVFAGEPRDTTPGNWTEGIWP